MLDSGGAKVCHALLDISHRCLLQLTFATATGEAERRRFGGQHATACGCMPKSTAVDLGCLHRSPALPPLCLARCPFNHCRALAGNTTLAWTALSKAATTKLTNCAMQRKHNKQEVMRTSVSQHLYACLLDSDQRGRTGLIHMLCQFSRIVALRLPNSLHPLASFCALSACDAYSHCTGTGRGRNSTSRWSSKHEETVGRQIYRCHGPTDGEVQRIAAI